MDVSTLIGDISMNRPLIKDMIPRIFIRISRRDAGADHRNNTPTNKGKINRAFIGFTRLV